MNGGRPYYAVIFTSTRTGVEAGYEEMAERMAELAARQPGFLGFDSARDDALGITVSYWESEAAIAGWKRQMDHQVAQRLGRERWYQRYRVLVARVEREYGFDSETKTEAPT